MVGAEDRVGQDLLEEGQRTGGKDPAQNLSNRFRGLAEEKPEEESGGDA